MTPASLYFTRLTRTRCTIAAKAIMQQAANDSDVTYSELQGLLGSAKALFPAGAWGE